MNGKVKGIIACGAVAASLAGVMVFLNVTENSGTADNTSSNDDSVMQDMVGELTEDHSVVILEKESADIVSIKATNDHGGFTLAKSASGKTAWTIEEIDGLEQNTILESYMLGAAGPMSAYKTAEENVTDWAKYGLDTPRASFEVSYADGTSAVVEVGEPSPEKKYSYIRVQGNDTAYMIEDSKLAYFLDPPTAYAQLSLIEQPEEGETPPYGTLTITRSDWDEPVVIENEYEALKGMLSEQVISSPIYSYLNMNDSPPVTHGMWGLAAKECTIAFPTDEQLAECGLDEPACIVSFKGEGYNYLLKIGDKVYAEVEKEGDIPQLIGYYCTIEGVSGRNAVYTISAENLPWATFKIEDITSDIVLPHFLIEMKDVTVTANGVDNVFEITVEPSANDETHMEVTRVVLDGKDIDIKQFKKYYEYLMTSPVSELCFDEPTGECEFALVEHMSNGNEDKLEFFKDTSRRYIVKHNGVTTYRIQSTWIDTLIKNVDNLRNGQPIDDNF